MIIEHLPGSLGTKRIPRTLTHSPRPNSAPTVFSHSKSTKICIARSLRAHTHPHSPIYSEELLRKRGAIYSNFQVNIISIQFIQFPILRSFIGFQIHIQTWCVQSRNDSLSLLLPMVLLIPAEGSFPRGSVPKGVRTQANQRTDERTNPSENNGM